MPAAPTKSTSPSSPPPKPRKRHPRRLSLFDLPSRVRSLIYTHYFTYPQGLHLHLIYSGHFPPPTLPASSVPTSSAGPGTNPSPPPTPTPSAWPYPSEPVYPPISYLFSSTQTTLLPSPSLHARHITSLYPSDNAASPTTDLFPATRISTRRRLHELHADAAKGPAYEVSAALLRACRAVNTEARGLVWRCNAVYLVTGWRRGCTVGGEEDCEGDDECWDPDGDHAPRDGEYHFHLGVLPVGVLRGIRELVLPAGEVVAELPCRGVRPVDLVVQRRVWGVVEREMPGLRVLGVGVGDAVVVGGLWGVDVRRFLGWCVGEMRRGKGWEGKLLLEVGEQVVETGVLAAMGWEDSEWLPLKGFVVEGRNAGAAVGGDAASGNSAEGSVGEMALPSGLREVRIKMVLPKALWKDLEKLRWGDFAPVKVGRKKGTVLRDGEMVRWDAAVFEMRRSGKSEREGKGKGKGAEGLQGKVHESLKGAAKAQERARTRKMSLSDKVYEKLRLKG